MLLHPGFESAPWSTSPNWDQINAMITILESKLVKIDQYREEILEVMTDVNAIVAEKEKESVYESKIRLDTSKAKSYLQASATN